MLVGGEGMISGSVFNSFDFVQEESFPKMKLFKGQTEMLRIRMI